MTKKLINIKNLLRIVISLFVIVNMVKSCAKALTYDEIKDYVNQTADYYSSNSNYQTIKNLVNNNANVISFLNNNASYYSAICLGRNASFNHAYNITLANFTSKSTNGVAWSGTGNYIDISYDTRYSSTYAGNNTSFSNSSPYSFGNSIYMRSGANLYSQLTGMCYENFDSYTGTIGATYVGKEHLAPLVNIYFGHLFSTTITLNSEEMQAIELDYNYRIEFIENVVTEDNEITSMIVTLDNKQLEVQDMGNYWTIKENNSTTLKYNQIYTLNVKAIVNGNEEEIEEKIIFIPPGTTISGGVITSLPSGDFGFTTENATNQIIENQNQNNNEIIQSINNIVGNLPDSTSGDASGDLSSGFDGGGGILGGIFSLFVPDGQFFKSYFEDLNNWFSDRLGLLYFPIELTIDFLTRCLNIDFTQQVLTLGPYVLPLNDDFELVPEINIDFNSFLEDETVNTIHEVYLFIIDGLIIFGLYRLILNKYNNIIKNKGGS